jgi:hypothetical protein
MGEDTKQAESALVAQQKDVVTAEVLSGGLAWSVTPNMAGSRLSSRTIGLRCVPLPPVIGIP